MRYMEWPDWSAALRQYYWQLRMCRSFDLAKQRKLYRRIRVERDSLIDAGHNRELCRLMCRYLADTSNQFVLNRILELQDLMASQARFAAVQRGRRALGRWVQAARRGTADRFAA